MRKHVVYKKTPNCLQKSVGSMQVQMYKSFAVLQMLAASLHCLLVIWRQGFLNQL